jgi:NAD(P)-dependent dehydrogenase (short-subunit alcohol dehydrogenase family)
VSTQGPLAGRVAIVTGGASAIGRAIALRVAADGARVVVADVRDDPREGGTPTHEVIREHGGEAVFVRTDVSDLGDLEAMVEAAEQYGGVDLLVNCAGLLRAGRLVDFAEADFDALMAVNVKGLYFACQAATRSMVAAKRPGVIINLSSVAGLHGMKGLSAYAGAKGAVRLLSHSLAQELGSRGIRVCTLHPGVIDTSMTRVDVPVDGIEAGIPLGRKGTTDDVANAVAFLASDQASFVSGASLTIDGAELSAG